MTERPTVVTERVDDSPLLVAQMRRMELPPLLDSYFGTHGNRQGLSLGWTTAVWLTHVLSQGDHRLNQVQPWAERRLETLRACTNQPVQELDLTDDRLADVRLARGFPEVPARKILTSGCTGGVSFGKYLEQIEQFRVAEDDVCVAPGRMYELLRALYDHSNLYRRSGGVHTSILVERDGTSPRLVAEDIGRHNTLDKLQGMALLEGVATRGGVVLASGRISSEMLFKAAIMGVPVVGSRTSPTNLALAVAERLNITVCGYIRQGSMNVYTHPERIQA